MFIRQDGSLVWTKVADQVPHQLTGTAIHKAKLEILLQICVSVGTTSFFFCLPLLLLAPKHLQQHDKTTYSLLLLAKFASLWVTAINMRLSSVSLYLYGFGLTSVFISLKQLCNSTAQQQLKGHPNIVTGAQQEACSRFNHLIMFSARCTIHTAFNCGLYHPGQL